MKALASMAVKFKQKSSRGQQVPQAEEKQGWSNPPLVLVNLRPSSERVSSLAPEDGPHFKLGYN